MKRYLEIEYIDNNGGGIERIENLEQLKGLINHASYKSGYEVLNINYKVED